MTKGGSLLMSEPTKRDIALEEQLWKDPDWTCPSCQFVNKAIREKCRNCGFDSAAVHAGLC